MEKLDGVGLIIGCGWGPMTGIFFPLPGRWAYRVWGGGRGILQYVKEERVAPLMGERPVHTNTL